MKKILRIPLLLVALLLTSIPLSAHDFEVDGIYYNITSSTDKTVEVTYSGGSYDAVANEYTGSVEIPETVTYSDTTYSVTTIGGYAFKDCTGLTSVTIPESIITIGGSPFYGCTGLTTINFNATNCTIMGSIVYPVFSNCSALTTLNIGDNVTIIPAYAFYECTGLTSVTIPESVITIEVSAFSGCTGLTSVTIPNSVTSVGNSAFEDCTGLITVNFNATDCTSMGIVSYSVFSGCTKFTTLNIGDNVTRIPAAAFSGCSGLTSVTIPESVITIGESAFRGCTGLTSVTIPNSVTSIGSSAFSGCTGLTSVIIPNSVTSIGGYAFKDCTGLTSVTISNSVTSIGDYAFYKCTSLITITLNCETPPTIDLGTFYNYNATLFVPFGALEAYQSAEYWSNFANIVEENPSINGLKYSKISDTEVKVIGVTESINNIIIPSTIIINNKTYTVIEIAGSAFYERPGLTSVTIPNSVTTIGDYAFKDCTGLTSVTIPNSVTSIGDCAFSGCTGLTTINFNATNCTTMGSSSDPVFNGCTAFTTLNIGDNVTNIPSSAFKGCTGLTSVTIPNSVTSIDNNSFYGCSGLTSVDLGNGVKYLGSQAFYGCVGITEITIPNSVTEINSPFRKCTGLKTINYNAVNSITTEDAEIAPGCTALTTLNIGESVMAIPNRAFYGCNRITSLSLPASVISVGNYSFYNCSDLASLSGGENLSSIGNYAFWGCNKLINANVTRTQTTATINLTSPTQYNLGLYYNNSDKMQAENGVVKFTGLKPDYTNSNYDIALIINGIYCPIKDLSFTTQSFSAYLSGSATTTSVSAIGTYTNGDVTILGEGINYGSSVTNYDGNNTITVYNLNPKTSYAIYYAVKTQEGGVYSTYKYFTTGDLTWSNGGFTATSTTSARLSVETTCDATAGTGFEWKRYDAPESLAPSKAPCPVVDGMLVGSLRNLNPDVYYKCRPYYTSSSGTTYYGEWITFFTGDANVYFEPEVRTFSERSVVNNSVTVRGYALPGTDDISEQGFEYWKVPASRAASIVMTVKASGISMTATLADLEYNSTYRYRAYVKTAQGTFYGAEEEFSIGEDPAGIEYIEVDDSNNFDVMLRENPATATAWVKVAGTSAIEAEYYILTTNGGVVANGFIPADGEYQPIELNIANGLYLMTVTDGSHRKTLRLIVR